MENQFSFPVAIGAKVYDYKVQEWVVCDYSVARCSVFLLVKGATEYTEFTLYDFNKKFYVDKKEAQSIYNRDLLHNKVRKEICDFLAEQVEGKHVIQGFTKEEMLVAYLLKKYDKKEESYNFTETPLDILSQ